VLVILFNNDLLNNTEGRNSLENPFPSQTRPVSKTLTEPIEMTRIWGKRGDSVIEINGDYDFLL